MKNIFSIPEFVKSEFPKFYLDMFETTLNKENRKVVVTEYFWNMGWCDPCASDPLSNEELRSLGVFWLQDNNSRRTNDVMITRLHVKYSKNTFPEDLSFQETTDSQNFQGRYVIRHPFKSQSWSSCSAMDSYLQRLPELQEKRAQNLANLTGWDIGEIRKKMNLNPSNIPKKGDPDWWKRIWK